MYIKLQCSSKWKKGEMYNKPLIEVSFNINYKLLKIYGFLTDSLPHKK